MREGSPKKFKNACSWGSWCSDASPRVCTSRFFGTVEVFAASPVMYLHGSGLRRGSGELRRGRRPDRERRGHLGGRKHLHASSGDDGGAQITWVRRERKSSGAAPRGG